MTRIPRQPAAVALVMLAGCASVPTHYYTLAPEASPAPSTNSFLMQHGVVVSTTSIPDLVDRLQLVVRESPTSVSIAESRQWAQPLRDQIPEVLMRNLRLELGSVEVVEDPRLLADRAPLRIVVNIEQFDATPGIGVTIAARWAISGGGSTSSTIGELTATQPIPNGEFETIVDGWSKALASISAALAKSLQLADAR